LRKVHGTMIDEEYRYHSQTVVHVEKNTIGLWVWKKTDEVIGIFWDASHAVLRVFMLFDQVRDDTFIFTCQPGKGHG
jgi:hypothetical protein